MAVPIHKKPCERCGGPRSIYGTKVCRQCFLNGLPEDDIWAHMDFRPDDQNAPPLGYCWEWQGGRRPSGYGRFTVSGGRRELVHRLAYQLTHPGADMSLMVCHHCDNPPCMRPDHLFLGTSDDNFQDAKAKGRNARGSRHGMAKLSESDVLELLRLDGEGWSGVRLAKHFDISRTSVCLILKGTNWKYLPRPTPAQEFFAAYSEGK